MLIDEVYENLRAARNPRLTELHPLLLEIKKRCNGTKLGEVGYSSASVQGI
jgi:hypothetical protein